MNKRPLAVAALFFILGIVLARYLPESVKFVHVLAGTCFFIFSAFLFNLFHRVGGPENVSQ